MIKYFIPVFILFNFFFSFNNESRSNTKINNISDSANVKIALKALMPYKISESSGLVFTDGNL